MQTDQGFWKVFSLQFMAGHGFGEEDRAGGTKAVVVCASVARKLFGTTDAVGQQLLLNREPARVIGVVRMFLSLQGCLCTSMEYVSGR